MLYTFLYPYFSSNTIINVLRYPSFRIIAAALTAGLLSFLLYPFYIKKLQKLSFGQIVRSDGPESHFSKKGTPTMGGLLLVISSVFSTLLWGDLTNLGLWLLLLVFTSYALIGLYDDLCKIFKKNTSGLSAKGKLLFQIIISSLAIYLYYKYGNLDVFNNIYFPFVSTEKFHLSLPFFLFLPFAIIVVVGTSNAVNLTDGLDGLAIFPVIISSFVFLILAYLAGSHIGDLSLAEYLKIPKIAGSYEYSIFCAAIIGSSIGFLWYNTYPAQVFMGDVGSLSLGGALGFLAVLSKNELLSAILHGVFLAEALSVILQVGSFKLYKRRIFKMAPLHHHFELLGWPEPKVIVRFWIISSLLAMITLISVKFR